MRIPIILSQYLLFFYNTHYFLYSIYTKNRKVGYVDKYGRNVFTQKNRNDIRLPKNTLLYKMRTLAKRLNIKNYLDMSKNELKDYLGNNIKVQQFVKK